MLAVEEAAWTLAAGFKGHLTALTECGPSSVLDSPLSAVLAAALQALHVCSVLLTVLVVVWLMIRLCSGR